METVNEILAVIGYTLFLALVFWLLGLFAGFA
jgi:preprotein translocase subunit SecE